MKTARWGTPSQVAQYEFRDGKRYTESELRELARDGRIRTDGGHGTPLRVGYVYTEERGKSSYELDWLPQAQTMVSSAEDDPREWPVEPPPAAHGSGRTAEQ